MSLKAKDLTYDATQPAFLQRLRGQIAGDDSARHENPLPRNKKLERDEEDDAPTYVLEDTNESLTKAEYDALVAGKDVPTDSNAGPAELEKKESEPPAKDPKDNIADIGRPSKKRKAVKVIGGSEEENGKDDTKSDAKIIKKPKKKSKAVKLSFDD